MSESARFDSGGGIWTLGLVEVIWRMSSLACGLPGTMMKRVESSLLAARAPSWVLSRNSALRALSSGPWHL